MSQKRGIIRTHISSFSKKMIYGFFIFLSTCVFGQDQTLADSLETIYVTGDFEEEKRLGILTDLTIKHPVSAAKIKYSNELLALAKEMDSSQYLFVVYLEKGNAYSALGEYPEAIENFLNAGDIALQRGDSTQLAMMYGSVANIYLHMGNYQTCIPFYKKSIAILKNNMQQERDSIKFAVSLENLGYTYSKLNKPDSALILLNKSGELFRKFNDTIHLAFNQLNKGEVYTQKKEYKKAEKSINLAFPVIEKYGYYDAMCQTLIDISEIYLVKNEMERASESAYKSLEQAMEHNLKSEISQANLQLSKIYEQTGNDKQAMVFYKNHIIYRDSVTNLSSVQEIANMRTDFEVAQKQTEIDLKQSEVELLNQQKSNLRILAFSMIALLGLTGFYFRNIRRAKRRSDDLLLNILPSSTAQELKENGKVKAKKFDEVTVMFTDFQAFTRYSENLSPEVLVKSVDFFFSKFDEIIDKYELEKIKTIGDAYMCAGGLTHVSKDEVIKILQAAFEIKKFVEKMRHSSDDNIAHFNIRIGINTGPVVAGVVGTKKFAYDIWGDTVNIASRMESNSDAGRINVSENTYQLIRDHFDCEYRGEIDVKNKGMMKMYFVNGAKKNPQNPVKDKSFKVLC
ncbi:adenylate/guanylate cyclase domain-containing protein [Lutimonas zeaxanthinifaciens]|uniref:adenylate/guanylate cyclase domain-containing protein n=1 Tax=Lutimonas zeaxanthinifaciens TaxID=3060215 RepID=UPI00265CE8AD|nr:adenylate/guanylate cyclase domain-containing protein [Lutimonas sp. YSD2104]WKK65665.1 adenylate/guanylate cyclase domain-containing protein [Lutimonas sp. YSD2104]